MSSLFRRAMFSPFILLALGALALVNPLRADDSTGAGNSPSALAPSGAPLTPSTAASAPAEQTQAPSDSYVLKTNDFIRISVYQEDDLLTETRISKSGDIYFPLLGVIHLEGKTVGEAVSEIRTRLDKDYIIDPHVSLTMVQYAQQWVTLLGEVQKPGQIEIPPEGGLDLLGAIALAGGYTRVADPSRVIVRRTQDGRELILRVDARRLARDARVQPFMVEPGDRISVAESIW